MKVERDIKERKTEKRKLSEKEEMRE